MAQFAYSPTETISSTFLTDKNTPSLDTATLVLRAKLWNTQWIKEQMGSHVLL